MNKKVGFDWYSVETDRYDDIRIRRLNANCGTKGLAVYDYLLARIYRDKGCYIICDDDCIFAVAEYLKMTESSVKEIISYCGSVGLFHDEFLLRDSNGALLPRGGVITSRAIQRRYVVMCELAKRKVFEMPADFILIDDILCDEQKFRRITENSGSLVQNSGNLSQNSGNLGQNSGMIPEISPHSIVQYSIVKYNKHTCSSTESSRVVVENVVAEAPTALQEEVVETTSAKPKISAEEKKRKAIEARKKREQDLYNDLIPYVEIYGKEMIREFYDYWTQTNGDDDVTNLMDIAKRKSGKFCLSRRLATWKQKDDERKARIGSSQPRSGNDGGAGAHAAYGGKRESYQQIDDLTSQVIS